MEAVNLPYSIERLIYQVARDRVHYALGFTEDYSVLDRTS